VDVGDVAERIDGIAGCHLALPEPKDLAAKMRLVQRADCRVNAREKIQELSVANIAFKLESFYRDTLSRWNRTVGLDGRRSGERVSVLTVESSITNSNFSVD